MAASNNQPPSTHHCTERVDALPRLIAVSGPTAVGKTALSIELALAFAGEVVNADSRYLYRGFDIGVAKPDFAERRGVPHHLIDVLPPDGDMSLARFQDLAMAAIANVAGRDRLPLLVGGTPLYINAVVEGWRIPRVPPDPEFRARLEAEVAQSGIAPLIQQLRAVDPAAAERHGSNVRRIIRALEVYEATGMPMTAQEVKGPAPYNALELGLTMPRERLYQAVDARVHDQIERGLIVELQSLLDAGVPQNAPAMGSLGYRQLLPYLRGESSLEAAITRIQYDTHRYVRHQETWLRRNPRLVWFDVTEPRWQEAAIVNVRRFLDAPSTRPPHG